MDRFVIRTLSLTLLKTEVETIEKRKRQVRRQYTVVSTTIAKRKKIGKVHTSSKEGKYVKVMSQNKQQYSFTPACVPPVGVSAIITLSGGRFKNRME